MNNDIFGSMEIDAIGELMNISLGSSATAVSNMLDHRVDITTPTVSVVQAEEFELGDLDPAIALVIKYVTGLEGSNIMLLKRSDIKTIVDILMGSETTDEEFQLDELTISAVCEVMNQMMGAAATALSDFLERPVNISTPESYELVDLVEFKKQHFPCEVGPVVAVRFMLSIENALESEFINIMSVELARDLVSGFGLGDDDVVAETPAPAPAAQPQMQQPQQMPQMQQPPMPDPAMYQQQMPQMQQPPMPDPAMYQQQMQPQMQQQMQPQMMDPAYMQQMGYPPMPQYPYPPQQAYVQPQPKVISTQPMQMQQLDLVQTLGEEQAQNLDLIMSVPLEVTVEIGRTRRKVQEILSYTKGSLVVLDKLAGDQVDLFVNGKCIARGDVVVIDDNFGIRITEILQKSTIEELAGVK